MYLNPDNFYVPILGKPRDATANSSGLHTSRDVSKIASTAPDDKHKIKKCTTVTMSAFWPPQQARQRMQNTFDTPAEVLHAAVRDDDLDRLQRLLVQGHIPDLNRENYAWGTPLHVATWCDNIQAVRILLNAGANPLVQWEQPNSSVSAIQLAAATGNHTILRELWAAVDPRAHANDKYGSCLVDASKHGQATIVDWLLTAWDGWDAETTRKAMLEAVSQWQAEVVDVLLRRVKYEEVVRYEMLEKACGLKALPVDSGKPVYEPEDEERQRSLVSRLLSTGLDPNYRHSVSAMPVLHIAASNVALGGALSELLASGELRAPLVSRGGYGKLTSIGADPNIQDDRGQTVMHKLTYPLPTGNMTDHTTLHSRHLLTPLEYGASVSIGDENGETPLHLASFSFPRETFVLWLSHGQDAQYKSLVQSNNHGESLLHYAAAGGNIEVLQYLLELDMIASKFPEGSGGIDAETMRHIREQGALQVNAASRNGWTPFLCALTRTVHAPTERRLGSKSIFHEKSGADALRAAQLLLSAGADPSLISAEGWTPLHNLAGHTFPDTQDAKAATALAEELIATGADVNARAPAFLHGWWEGGASHKGVPWQWRLPWGFRAAKLMAEYPGAARRGITPLHWAAENGCVCVARVLLAHGADLLAEDEKGATPETTARYSMRIAASLKEEMARLLKLA